MERILMLDEEFKVFIFVNSFHCCKTVKQDDSLTINWYSKTSN